MANIIQRLCKILSFAFKGKIIFIVLMFFCLTIILFNIQKNNSQQKTGRIFFEQVEPIKHQNTHFVPNKNTEISGEKEKDLETNQIRSKNRTVWKSLPPGTQMGEQQVAAITKVLPQAGNLLVWGLGNDSPFWHDSTKGKVIFIEPKGFWYDKVKNKFPYLEAYSVKYTTETVKSFKKYINNRTIWSELDLRSELPPVVIQTPWDVIIVDAPPGYNGAPGRYQSIYTSSLIAQNGSHIFVDDYERKVEREFSRKMLGTPVEIVRRKAKGMIGANEQAHFIYASKRLY